MRYFADTIKTIWEDIKELFGPSKAFYTFLGIGLAIWLISATNQSATNQATVFSEIGKAIFLFCLIKLAIERAPKRDLERETIKALKAIGIKDIIKSRASLTFDDVEFLTKARKRVWIAGFFIDDLLDASFVYPKGSDFGKKANEILRTLIDLTNRQDFDLKLLMLDPLNRASYLHQTLDANFVDQCRQKIKSIERFLIENDAIKLKECIRLSRTYPMISLAIADDTAIFQPWLFKDQASARLTRIGVFRCIERMPVVKWLSSHFEAIWTKQSVSLDDFQEGHARGTDCAVQYLDIANMYIARHGDIDATPRMLAILKNTEKFLCVKQVSLRHLLTNINLNKELKRLLQKSIPVQLLFINVNSEAAMTRSYGEYIHGCELNDEQPTVETYDEFKKSLLRHNQPLYRDTQDAIEIAKGLQNTYPSLSIRTYYAAPDAAIIVNEHSALFEALHYGAKKPRTTANGAAILSGEMPLMEFKKDDQKEDGQVYDVIKSNFDFVWKHLSESVKDSGNIS